MAADLALREETGHVRAAHRERPEGARVALWGRGLRHRSASGRLLRVQNESDQDVNLMGTLPSK